MAKNIRFGDLVAKCGRPETLTLWTKPEENPALSKAIRENRVMTVIQEPKSHKKDFGLIGFHQHQFALYFLFPKRLPKVEDDATVVGIRYELVKQFEGVKASQPPPVRPKKKAAPKAKVEPKGLIAPSKAAPPPSPPAPEKKRYMVTVLRTGNMETNIEVAALNIADAEAEALKKVERIRFVPNEVRAEVKSISER